MPTGPKGQKRAADVWGIFKFFVYVKPSLGGPAREP